MANLESIRTHYLSLQEPFRRQFVTEYREKRARDLASTRQAKPPREKKEPRNSLQLSPEEKLLCKTLGISQAQIKAMRSLN